MRSAVLVVAAAGIVAAVGACVNDVDEGEVMGAGAFGTGDEQAMTSKCAGGTTVRGIDVSAYQGTINWSRVAGDGVKFAYVRVSDGLGFHDSKFGSNWSGAKAHGVLRGAYQFFRSNEDPVAQADLLISKVGGHLGADDLPPVIDVESSDGQSAHTIATKVERWLKRVKDKLGVDGIVYTGPYFWADSVGGADVGNNKLWVAHYGTQCPLVPPGFGGKWTMHQYSSSGSVNGIGGSVDMDHFNGTLAQLKDLTAGPDFPRGCVTGHFHGEFCDDDNSGSEHEHDALKRELGVDFHCHDKAGSPAFCGDAKATRSQTMFVLGAAAKIPLAGHPNAFHDDNDDPHEKYLNAAKAYGIMLGSNGKVNPDAIADRDQVAVLLYRMYKLQDVDHDYFFDDDGDRDEHVHNAVAAAGLMTGYDDPHHTRNKFAGGNDATRSMIATLAVRAHDRGLVPVWEIADACLAGHWNGTFCDDDGRGNEDEHERLKTELGVNLSCKLAGSTAFCGGDQASRAETMYVLGQAAGMPLAGHPDAFVDDDGTKYEAYLNAAKAYGIMNGWAGGKVKPHDIANRDTIAVVLSRMYNLPDPGVDYFTDDNGDADEAWHNKVGAAGLFTGYDDGHGGRKFLGNRAATRDMLATIAVRAKDAGLVAAW